MTLQEIMSELKAMGNADTKRIFMNHGAQEPLFGVKVGDLKKILKKTKTNHNLAIQLYETGNSDAMYLAALMADHTKVTREKLQSWIAKANWYMLSEYAVAGLAAESPYGLELSRHWRQSDQELVAAAGWATYSGVISITENSKLDLKEIDSLLDHIKENIHHSPDRVRYTMNGFLITVGGYIPSLTAKAKDISTQIGKVTVNLGNTACKVPYAPEYIAKMVDRGSYNKKRQAVRC